MSYQVEKPIHNHRNNTYRSLDMQAAENAHLVDDKDTKSLKDLLDEVKIRFDTNPKYYEKNDYVKLMHLLQALQEIIIDLQNRIAALESANS